MSDQAYGLRQLVQTGTVSPQTLVFASGKGGVGTSNVVLNLAIALAGAGQRVLLIDADFGLANLDLLGGGQPSCDLGDVLSANRPLSEAVTDGPNGLRLLAGAHGARTDAARLATAAARLVAGLDALRPSRDFILIDAGSGLGRCEPFLPIADAVVVVTTPEPTSLADTCALFARCRPDRSRGPIGPAPELRFLVNQALSRREGARTIERLRAEAREFLGLVVVPIGVLPNDPHVGRAVRRRQAVVLAHPHCRASRGARRLARALIEERARATKLNASGEFRPRIAAWRPRVRAPAVEDVAVS